LDLAANRRERLPLTDAERAFDSEDAALSDAVRTLNGEAVAV
jgi:hypothetical protein